MHTMQRHVSFDVPTYSHSNAIRHRVPSNEYVLSLSRELLLGVPPCDWSIATSAAPVRLSLLGRVRSSPARLILMSPPAGHPTSGDLVCTNHANFRRFRPRRAGGCTDLGPAPAARLYRHFRARPPSHGCIFFQGLAVTGGGDPNRYAHLFRVSIPPLPVRPEFSESVCDMFDVLVPCWVSPFEFP